MLLRPTAGRTDRSAMLPIRRRPRAADCSSHAGPRSLVRSGKGVGSSTNTNPKRERATITCRLERLMPVLCSQTSDLDKITGRLRHLLDTISIGSGKPDAQTRVMTPEEMSDLLSWLMRAGQSLRSLSSNHSVPEEQITQYRTEVQ